MQPPVEPGSSVQDAPCCTDAPHVGTPPRKLPASGREGKTESGKWSGRPPSPHCRGGPRPPLEVSPPPSPVMPPVPATPPLPRLTSAPPSGSDVDELPQPKKPAPIIRLATQNRSVHRSTPSDEGNSIRYLFGAHRPGIPSPFCSARSGAPQCTVDEVSVGVRQLSSGLFPAYFRPISPVQVAGSKR